MSPNRFRLTFFILMLSFLVLGQGVITQLTAHKLGHQYQLGDPIFYWGKIPVYNPFSFIFWYMNYYHYAKNIFSRGLIYCYLHIAGIVFFSVLMNVWRYRQSKESETYGTARWANFEDVKLAKLNSQYGIVLGYISSLAAQLQRAFQTIKKQYPFLNEPLSKIISILQRRVLTLHHDGPEHVLINAPSRSGKGVSIIIPTLLSWGQSVLVMDIKGENWALTSGFRSKFSHCLCFNPTNQHSAKWNPLHEIRKGDNEVRDVQNVADILVDPDGTGKSKTHWEKTGHALLVATILHILYAEKDKTLSGVANFLADPSRDIYKTLEHMLKTPHKDGKVHPVVASAAREMLNKSENELSGVLSTAMSFLGLYRDPIVARNTSECDFRVEDLMNAEKPVSLYLVVPPSDISRLAPLNRLMLNLILRRLTEKSIGAGGSPHKHRLLCLLDEFPSFGSMDFFKTSLGFLAGYGIKCMLICQSYNNIYELYGPKNSIFDNCHIRATMAPNDNQTAHEVSTSLGQTTVKRYQTNFTGRRLALWLSNISVASQESPRNLLNGDEVQKLPEDKLIVMVAKTNPILANKILYYQDEPYLSRLMGEVSLSDGQVVDKPKAREHDWSSEVVSLYEETECYKESSLDKDIENEKKQEEDVVINITDATMNNETRSLDNETSDMDYETAVELTAEKDILF